MAVCVYIYTLCLDTSSGVTIEFALKTYHSTGDNWWKGN